MYFMDERNNLYYDSGNKEVGWFQVSVSHLALSMRCHVSMPNACFR